MLIDFKDDDFNSKVKNEDVMGASRVILLDDRGKDSKPPMNKT